jgi:GDP-L-fucose synthase
VLQHYSDEVPLNIGTGEDITITDFAHLVAEVVGYAGAIKFDTSRPDGMPRKLLDIGRLASMGWRPQITLRDGLRAAYADFRARFDEKVEV